LDTLLDALAALEKASWKGDEEIGIFTTENGPFNRALIRHFVETGECRFWWIAQGDRIVTYRVGFHWGDAYWDYQTSFHPDVADLKLSHTLLLLVIQDLIEAGVKRYEFGSGVQRFKLEWATTLREVSLVRIYRPSLGGAMLRSLASIKRAARGDSLDARPALPLPLKEPLPPLESGGGAKS
jgi:CelD/BcsL family acetyltransferase involved in cellulose biosynthesis